MSYSATVVDGVIVLIPPPKGYKVNFAHPTQRHDTIAYVIFGIGVPLSTFCFLQYLYVKLRLQRKVDAQLVCLAIGWVLSLTIQILEIRQFAIKIVGVHTWEMPIQSFQMGAYYLAIVPIIIAIMTGVCKTSLGLFYFHLSPQVWWRRACCLVLFFLVGYNVAMFIAIILACRPFERNWDPTVPGTCINRLTIYVIAAVLGIVSDLVLLVLPIPMIVGLQMPFRQKLGLVGFFAVGSLTLVTAILRLVLLIPTLNLIDISWTVSGTVLVIIVESNLLVICASLPTLRRFFAHVAPRFIAEEHSSDSNGSNSHKEIKRNPFKTIGCKDFNQKRVDEFGMTSKGSIMLLATTRSAVNFNPQTECQRQPSGHITQINSRNIAGYEPGTSNVPSVEEFLRTRTQVWSILRDNLHKAQNRMKKYYDLKKAERHFDVGDWVYLRLQPYRQLSVAHRKSLKLSPRFYGPFQVLKRIGSVAYLLDLLLDSLIHPIFHVSQLKKKLGQHISSLPTLPPMDIHGILAPEPDRVLDRRVVKRNNQAVTQLLTVRQGQSDSDAVWEDYHSLQAAYPHLVDKVF